MLNNINKTLCALAVLAATTLPALAESIDVKVIGTIDPTACTPTLSGGGTIDYGMIKPNTLNKDAFTTLAVKQLDFAITCDAPAKVAITATSQRGVSAVSSDGTLTSLGMYPGLFGITGNAMTFGLGLDGAKGIGGYSMRIAAGTVMADSQSVDSIQSNGDAAHWTTTPYGMLITGTGVGAGVIRYSSWATPGTTVPVAFTNLTGKLEVQAYINKTSELDLTKPVTLDGLATLELVYL
ncbi:hypothetical protein C9426_23535 [Serratia sp. S1B]|nr:hypothetical protein C9426_23535 [Serratia sp. S1B]